MAPSGLRRPNDPPLLILVSLADGPKHGHALAKDIEDFAGVKLGPGALHGAITRLAERPDRAAGQRRPAPPVPDHPAGFGRAGRGAGGHVAVARAGLTRLGLDPA